MEPHHVAQQSANSLCESSALYPVVDGDGLDTSADELAIPVQSLEMRLVGC